MKTKIVAQVSFYIYLYSKFYDVGKYESDKIDKFYELKYETSANASNFNYIHKEIYCNLSSIIMKLHEFLVLVNDKQSLIKFLVEVKLIRDTLICEKCNNIIQLDVNNFEFKCSKSYFITNCYKKKQKIRCIFRQSARKNTWFDKSNLTIEKICIFVAYFVMLRPPRHSFLKNQLEISDHTVVDWHNFCREVCVYWVEKRSEKIGGEGKIVEIDEAKIGKRKYNRGRLIDGKWIFGGYERDSGRMFIVPVPERTKETLIQVIKEWILPKTIIISDCWKAYKCLENEDFKHLTVNRSLNFVDPETGAHTQNIERLWREVRANIPRFGTKEAHLISYLAEFIFKRKFNINERIPQFFKIISELYPSI